jgi:cobalt/nickel transport protein
MLALVIVSIPFALFSGDDLSGTDDQATEAIGNLRPGYEPWMSHLWDPEDMESALFALQAVLGLGFIGYFFNYFRKQRAHQLGQN